LKHMKRLFPTSLALLLVIGSLGHVFAAAFCPRMLGHSCCLTKSASGPHSTQFHQPMHGMATDPMADESMSMNGSDMPGMTMDDADVSPSTLASDESPVASTSEELAPANKVELPVDACTHCMSHSGIQNAPVSSVSVPDQSNKNLGSVLLPVSRFLAKPAMTLTQVGLPREHAPPGSSAPRYVLISVFLI
jgi:hypothetical protein